MLDLSLVGGIKLKLAIVEILDVFEKLSGRRKVLVLCKSPRTAEGFNPILQFMGVKTNLLTGDINTEDRGQMLRQFQDKSEDNGCEDLMATYTLRIAGHNLHQYCCTVIELEQGTSFPEVMQACCRVHRPGADEIQKVYRLVMEDGYDQEIEKELFDNHSNIQIAGLEAEDLEWEGLLTGKRTKDLTARIPTI